VAIDLKFVYTLEHCYDLEDDFGSHEENKFIGIYTTHEKAEKTLNALKNKLGFKDYPIECFSINKVKLNQDSWVDGFTTYKYTD
jgi:hypothetical protein